MPRRVHDLTMLYRWMRDREVTAREIAEYLGCPQSHVIQRVLPALEHNGLMVMQIGVMHTKGRLAALYSPIENRRDKS